MPDQKEIHNAELVASVGANDNAHVKHLANTHHQTDILAYKVIAAGLCAISMIGVGLGLGRIFASIVESIARNPQARNSIFSLGILGAALTEAIALFALVLALIILFAV